MVAPTYETPVPAELRELFAAKETPNAVGRLSTKLLDDSIDGKNDYKAGAIKTAKEDRLKEIRELVRNSQGGTSTRTFADRAEFYLNDQARARRDRGA